MQRICGGLTAAKFVREEGMRKPLPIMVLIAFFAAQPGVFSLSVSSNYLDIVQNYSELENINF